MISFTIITCTYQAAEVLGRTLDSVLAQSHGRVEHLIIDGLSTDGTVALAEDYRRRSDEDENGHRVVVVSERDRGLYDAMNKGIAKATGDYLVFLNAGDVLPACDTLEQIACSVADGETLPGVLYGDTDVVDVDGHFLYHRRLQPPSNLSWRSFRHGMLQVLPVARDLVFEDLAEGVIVLDGRGQVTDFNRAAARFVDGLLTRSIGKALGDIDGARPIVEQLGASVRQPAASTNLSIEVAMPRAARERFFEVRLTPMVDRSGVVQCQALLLLDVTEKRALLTQLHRQATTDALTGIFNRHHFGHLAERAFLLARRTGEPLSLAVIDVDEFKAINDQRGHQAGDELLRLIADNARRRLRATDILGRFGGDEFVVILPATSAAEAVEVMRELGDACLAAGGASLSIGVADLAEDCASVQVLLNRADAQLYRAKKAGRHRVMAAFIP